MKSKLIFIFIFFSFCAFNIFAEEEAKPVKALTNLSFDAKTGAVSYTLTIPAKVRIRIGTKEGPLFRTIVDWEERGTGAHKEEWDGMDVTGKVKLVGKEDLVFTFNYYTEGDEFMRNIDLTDILPPPEKAIIGRHLPNLKLNQMHKEHKPGFCHEPKVEVKLPKDILLNKDSYYIIKEKTPVVISINQKDKPWFTAERYSIHIFVDGIFTYGVLEGYSPFNWNFDPSRLNQGKHLITINLSGFADHIGIASIPVYIEKARSKNVSHK